MLFFDIIIACLDVHYQNRFKCHAQQYTYWHITSHLWRYGVFVNVIYWTVHCFLNHKWCMYHNNEVWFSGIWKKNTVWIFGKARLFFIIVLATKYWLICGIYVILWMILKLVFFCINNHLRYEHVDIYCL